MFTFSTFNTSFYCFWVPLQPLKSQRSSGDYYHKWSLAILWLLLRFYLCFWCSAVSLLYNFFFNKMKQNKQKTALLMYKWHTVNCVCLKWTLWQVLTCVYTHGNTTSSKWWIYSSSPKLSLDPFLCIYKFSLLAHCMVPGNPWSVFHHYRLVCISRLHKNDTMWCVLFKYPKLNYFQ